MTVTDGVSRGRAGHWPRRLLRHHLPLAFASAAVVFAWVAVAADGPAGHQVAPRPDHATTPTHQGTTTPAAHASEAPSLQERTLMRRSTTASGYVATGLLTLTLLIGPVNLMLRRRNPVSSYLRRDVGAWAAIVSVVHVGVGLQVHGPEIDLGGRVAAYFFAPDGGPLLNAFGLGNWTGLAGTMIVVGLLAISSDAALRSLRARPWKWLQRTNYALFALVVVHAIYYGALTRVSSFSTVLLGVLVSTVLAAQVTGIWLYRRRAIAITSAAMPKPLARRAPTEPSFCAPQEQGVRDDSDG